MSAPMKGSERLLLSLVVALSTVAIEVRIDAAPPAAAAALTARVDGAADDLSWLDRIAPSIDRRALRLALGATSCALRSGAVADPSTLTVIDYSRPSTEKRLWVFDLRSRALLFHELVAHGAGTGDDVATRFSNAPETHRTSLGLFVTAETYKGAHGYSLRLDGLEPGFNDRARERAIVLHGAAYVTEAFARAHGRLGRSWGCPALNELVAPAIIDRVKGGSLVFAYYPDPSWLASSRYLGNCAAAD
jgi:hypothetical protein